MPSIRIEMNYLKTYINLIRSREKRGWDKKTTTEYVERHHIFPQKIYGEDRNGNKRCVYLTAREHYICHVLLEKICIQRYGKYHWKTISMTNAHILMKSKSNYYNSYLYEQAKKRKSDNMKGERHHLYNIGHSDSAKEKIKKNHYLNNGGIHSRIGRKHTEESKLKMSESQKGIKRTEEFCENQSKRVGGVNNPFYGKKHDEDTRKKMSDLKKGKKLSDDHKKNISKVTKGTVYINNGLISKRTSKDLKIPDGWIRGRVKLKSNTKSIK